MSIFLDYFFAGSWSRCRAGKLFAPTPLACCSKAHPAVRRELALWAQTALLTGAGFHQEQQRRGPKSLQSFPVRHRLQIWLVKSL